LQPNGMILIRGEYWTAHSVEGTLQKGERVQVQGLDGRTLLVRSVHEGDSSP